MTYLDEMQGAGPLERFRLADADRLVRPLVELLERTPSVDKVEVAGCCRRRKETVREVHILCASRRPASLLERLARCSGVAWVETAGRTGATVILRAGLPVHVRIVPPESFGATLQRATGSEAHADAVRRLAADRGLRICDHGVFRELEDPGGKAVRVSGAEERDVYEAAGLEWVPPELREGRGEIEAARGGRLPRLLRLEDIRGDLHLHTAWSDGHDSVEAMALAAAERGYAYLAVTDHSRAMQKAGGLEAADLENQWREIASVRRRLGSRIHVFCGMEVDVLRDGTLDLPDGYLEGLDVVVASVHSDLDLGRAAMTDRVIRAIAHPSVHILAHPTGRLVDRRRPIALDLEAVLKAAAELDVAVELNARPDRVDLNDFEVRRARDLGVKVVINSDAHSAGALSSMRYGVDRARRGWLEKDDVLNALPLADLQAWLDRGRGGRPARREARPRVREMAASACR